MMNLMDARVGMLWSIVLGCAVAMTAMVSGQDALEVLKTAGVKGGVVVHLRCGDGKLTAGLRANESYVVHGLESNETSIELARTHVKSLGLNTSVTIHKWTGPHLPYSDDFVNLVVAESLGAVPMAEVLRVLVPNGVLCVKEKGQWKVTRKPRRATLDEWSHFLHGPDGNCVSTDQEVGPPRRLKWIAAPKYLRSHEHLNSVSALVSGGGRVFYIYDGGPSSSINLPAKWFLIARDAFNGVVLWKRAIKKWMPHLHKFRAGPIQLPRRLVVSGNRIYVTLGLHAPLTELDAATGETLRTYEGVDVADEILVTGKTILLVTFPKPEMPAKSTNLKKRARKKNRININDYFPKKGEKSIVAVHAESGKILWKHKPKGVLSLTLATLGKRVFFHDRTGVICLDFENGKESWRADTVLTGRVLNGTGALAPTLVVQDKVVLIADGRKLFALSVADGKQLWAGKTTSGFLSPPDVLMIKGMVRTASNRRGHDFMAGMDPLTGEVKNQLTNGKLFGPYGGDAAGHHRCYREKAVGGYVLGGWNGADFLDLKTGKTERHDWIRGGCQYGFMPSNGMLYGLPHACWCYIAGQLHGVLAVAPAKKKVPGAVVLPPSPRLEKGPAFEALQTQDAATVQVAAADWPTYRFDNARSGRTLAVVGKELKPKWETKIGGRLSSLVMANGKVFVASFDEKAVYALAADTGKIVWCYRVGGLVDSPPTIYQGAVYFGARNGWLYCLRASDGKLAWRYRVAPEDRMIGAWGRVESAWPVPGSVLIQNGTVYCAAGRSSFLDGGIQLCGLNAKTGSIVLEKAISNYGANPVSKFANSKYTMAALPDVLSSDGKLMYLRHLAFGMKGEMQDKRGEYIYSASGFLDDTWFHRMYWKFGREPFGLKRHKIGPKSANNSLTGRLLLLDKEFLYGFGRDFVPPNVSVMWSNGEQYQFYCAKRSESAKETALVKRGRKMKKKPTIEYVWAAPAKLQARAMLMAKDLIFAVGPPPDAHLSLDSWEGRKGVLLHGLDAKTGETVVEEKLNALPVFDGMIAAQGRLFLALKDGSVRCLGNR